MKFKFYATLLRLCIIKDRHLSDSELNAFLIPKNLFDLYNDVLYIETEILTTDGKIYERAVKVFVSEAQKFDLDFMAEYENMLRTISYAGLQK